MYAIAIHKHMVHAGQRPRTVPSTIFWIQLMHASLMDTHNRGVDHSSRSGCNGDVEVIPERRTSALRIASGPPQRSPPVRLRRFLTTVRAAPTDKYRPYSSIMTRAGSRLMISEATGLSAARINTTLEALAHGVPMVVLPAGFAQPAVAAQIAHHD